MNTTIFETAVSSYLRRSEEKMNEAIAIKNKCIEQFLDWFPTVSFTSIGSLEYLLQSVESEIDLMYEPC